MSDGRFGPRRKLVYEDPVSPVTLDRMIIHPNNYNGGQHKIALIELKRSRTDLADAVKMLEILYSKLPDWQIEIGETLTKISKKSAEKI